MDMPFLHRRYWFYSRFYFHINKYNGQKNLFIIKYSNVKIMFIYFFII